MQNTSATVQHREEARAAQAKKAFVAPKLERHEEVSDVTGLTFS